MMTEEIRTQGCKHDRNRQVFVHGFRRLKKKSRGGISENINRRVAGKEEEHLRGRSVGGVRRTHVSWD